MHFGNESMDLLNEKLEWERMFMPLKVTKVNENQTKPFFANFGSFFEAETQTKECENITEKIASRMAADILSDYVESRTPKKRNRSATEPKRCSKTASGTRMSIGSGSTLQVIPTRPCFTKKRNSRDKSKRSKLGALKPTPKFNVFEKNFDN